MNYVYDIVVNFNKDFFDSFEWNRKDNIINIRKTVLFLVDDQCYYDFKVNNVLVCKDFVNKIYNKTECFTSKNVKLLNYVCLITNGLECIAIKLNKNGNIIEKSSLLVDEEFDILDSLNDMNIFDIKYKILNVKNNFSFMTRREKDIENFINFKLSNLSKKDFNKLKYLYFECFNSYINDYSMCLSKIISELKNNFDVLSPKIYNFFKLDSIKK